MVPFAAIASAMLTNLFQGAQSRRRRATLSVDATIRRVAAGVWAEVGAQRGLELSAETELMMRGAIRGVACEIALVGDGAATFTLAKGTHGKAFGGRVAIAPATRGRALAATLSRRRVLTGDPEIDASFVIVSEPPSLASALLGEDARAALMAMSGRNPHLAIEGAEVALELEGTEMVHDNLHAIIDLLTSAPPDQRASAYRTGA